MSASDSSETSTIASSLPINEVLGPVLLSVCLNAFFYGFSVLQFAQYRQRLFRDSIPTQLLVVWTFLLDTAHTAALCWMIWTYVVDNFSNPEYLSGAPWPFAATPSFLVATSAPIQFYFAHRAWELSRSRIILWSIITLSLANVALGIVSTVFAFTHADVHDFRRLLPLIDSWLALGVACDGLVALTLIYYLTKRQSGFRRHQSFRCRVAHAFIESSCLPALFALADLIVYSAVPNTNFHIILGIPMGRIYTCTLLAMLNARLKLQEDEADGIITKESQSYERRLEFANAFSNMKRGPTEVRVSVQIQQEEVNIKDLEERSSTDKRISTVVTSRAGSVRSADDYHKGPQFLD